MNLKIIEQYLRQKHDLAVDFHFYKWETLPHTGRDEWFYLELSGGVCPDYLRGPKKGKPNYSKATHRYTYQVSKQQCEQIMADYERVTGNCNSCEGEKQEWDGWSKDEGHKYRQCVRCGGTGKANEHTNGV